MAERQRWELNNMILSSKDITIGTGEQITAKRLGKMFKLKLNSSVKLLVIKLIYLKAT